MRGRTKKQLRRLWDATYIHHVDPVFDEDYTTQLRKPLSGKSARYLVGKYYKMLDDQVGWAFVGRPKFAPGRKYALLIEERRYGDHIGARIWVERVDGR